MEMELLQTLQAGGDVGTIAIVVFLVKHSNSIENLKVQIAMLNQRLNDLKASIK